YFHVFSEVAHIAGQGFKRINVAFLTNENAGEKRVETRIRPYIVNNVCGFDRFLNLPLFIMFVASQPAAVIAGSPNPFLAAQRALNNWKDCASRNQPQRCAKPLAYQSLVRNTGKIGQCSPRVYFLRLSRSGRLSGLPV